MRVGRDDVNAYVESHGILDPYLHAGGYTAFSHERSSKCHTTGLHISTRTFPPFPLLISFHRLHPYLPGDRRHFDVFNYSCRAAGVGAVDDRLTNTSSLPLSRRSTLQLHCLLQNRDAYHSITARNLDRQGLEAMCITKISLVSLKWFRCNRKG